MDLVIKVYNFSDEFPKEEVFNLTSQLKRSAISIPSNIAEGYGRNSTRDYVRFLQIASGSLYEFQTQLEICSRLEFLRKEEYLDLSTLSIEIEKMLSSLISKIKISK